MEDQKYRDEEDLPDKLDAFKSKEFFPEDLPTILYISFPLQHRVKEGCVCVCVSECLRFASGNVVPYADEFVFM